MFSRRAAFATLAAPLLRGQNQSTKMFGDAVAYDRFMGRWSNLLAPLLVDFTGLRDTGQVLDVGSGTGALAFAIAKRKPHCEVLGIDPSKEYVAYANSKNATNARTKFQVGDAQQLQFPGAMFESCLSLLVFNFIPDRSKALRELCRVTKPGSSVSAAVWDYGAGMKMLRVFWDAVVAVDSATSKLDERNMPLCRAGELAEFWRHEGLNRVEESPLDITMNFTSFVDYWDPFLLGQGPAGAYVRSADGDRRKALRAEVKRRLKLTAEDTPFSLPGRAWAVRGVVQADH